MVPTIDQSWYQHPHGTPTEAAAGGVILRQHRGCWWVALIREGSLPDYALPKGHVESGESLQVAARREIEEEAGFSDLQLLGELGVLERLNFSKTHWKITHYYLFQTEQVTPLPSDPKTHQVEWFPIDQLPPIFWPEQRQLLQQVRDEHLSSLECSN
ncbi:Putative mutator protein MutT4 [Halomicronema hongdechloris C2206]|uniref:Mutator protein MutT4 n=1 Tax=Halomicronema hongdechloris C2206 TaxID=1641165 RepID=A0A1Z3HP54_9CYAN|nr:NUDIX domain-containing protein [Halomicronema hongdechloris]ASC72093.1 Putative mutator protein MutT4 [Halomicronema hongdechloris C2206]